MLCTAMYCARNDKIGTEPLHMWFKLCCHIVKQVIALTRICHETNDNTDQFAGYGVSFDFKAKYLTLGEKL